MSPVFWHGLLAGLVLAVPIGPAGIWCIQRTLVENRRAGTLIALGAALADALYGGLAGMGHSLLAGLLLRKASLLRKVSGVLLIGLGIRSQRYSVSSRLSAPLRRSTGLFGTAFLLVFLNPLTLPAFIALLGSLHTPVSTPAEWLLLASGVFCGSWMWFKLLSWLAWGFRSRFSPLQIAQGIRFTGWLLVLAGLGAWLLP